jgi:hypothetical protein
MPVFHGGVSSAMRISHSLPPVPQQLRANTAALLADDVLAQGS